MKYDDIIALAEECGFNCYSRLNMDSLIFRTEIRDMCSADRCHAYGKSWRCPPAIGSIDEAFDKIKDFKSGVILQTIGYLEDEFDVDTIMETGKNHGESFIKIMRELKKTDMKLLGMGAGTCQRCSPCTYPDAPCRFPDDSYGSMEAYGLWVSDVCTKSDIPYNHGKGTLTYVSCVLFDKEI